MDVLHSCVAERRVATQSEASEIPKVRVNIICSVCEAIFARAKERKSEERVVSWYYDILGLRASVEKECHFCAQVLRRMKPEALAELDASHSTLVEKRLRAETEYYEDIGVAFMLRYSEGGSFHLLNPLCLYFTQNPTIDLPNTEDSSVLYTAYRKSPGILHQIHGWIKECSSEHSACKYSTNGPPQDQWPRRLLDVGGHNDLHVRLCETSCFGRQQLHYATLSHCWGSFSPIRLLRTNMSTFLDRIPLDSLPVTFREAVELTRELGLRYLWIDSLCIQQDSVGDWEIESNRMCEIFRNSYVNLAAAASADATGGLIYSSPLLSRLPCQVMVGRGDSRQYARTKYTPGTRQNTLDLPLLSRAWVFQEVLLPARVLFFTRNEVCWECNQMSRTETYPDGETIPLRPDEKLSRYLGLSLRENWPNISKKDRPSRFQIWNRVVREYSEMQMSKPSDKLVAIAGLVHDLGQTWPDVDYLAGIWSYDIIHGLLWSCLRGSRSRFYNAPSWSWASIDGEVFTSRSHDEERFCDTLVEVVEACTFRAFPNMTYGTVTDGYIRLKGPFVRGQMSRKAGGHSHKWTLRFLEVSAEELAKECEDFMSVVVDISVYWDDYGLEELFVVVTAHLMPFKISTKDGATCMKMEGIILSPVYGQKGHFKRIGLFEVEDQQPVETGSDASQSTRAELPNSQTEEPGLLASDSIDTSDEPHAFETLECCEGADEVPIIDIPSQEAVSNEVYRPFTALDIHLYQQTRDKEYMKFRKLPELLPLTKRLNNTVGSSHGRSLDKHDKFCNGIVDFTLVGRYDGQLDIECYWNINSILTYAHMLFELSFPRNRKHWEEFYEESHGGGIFTIRII